MRQMAEHDFAFHIAERLIRIEQAIDELRAARVAHDMDPGAHAAAFEAHGQSPGVVEDAEELAEDIIEDAIETAAEAAEIVGEVGEEVVADTTESVEEATEAAIETIADAAEPVAEIPEEVAGGETSEEEHEPVPEREPLRQHILHRKIVGRRT